MAMKRNHIWPPRIMGRSETLEYIHEHKCSIGRYGDGEIGLMVMMPRSFQKSSLRLRKELIQVSKVDDPGFLVCIPRLVVSQDDVTEGTARWWRSYLRRCGWIWRYFFSHGQEFGDSLITRPWMETQSAENFEMCFSMLSEEWKDKDVVMIEGEKSRIGVGNDFLGKAKSVKRILCPAKNAYSKIDEIESAALRFSKECLILIALGPAATVLAYRLYKKGFRALDIGHMDIEYEWYKIRAKNKVPVKNKYVNEAGGYKTLVETEMDEKYKSEIACIIR